MSLLSRIEKARRMVRHFNSAGQHDTIWHIMLARYEAQLAAQEQDEEPEEMPETLDEEQDDG